MTKTEKDLWYEVNDLERERFRIVSALLRYGRHEEKCARFLFWPRTLVPTEWNPDSRGPLCTCGLDEILATHVGKEPEWLIDEAKRRGIRILLCDHEPDVGNAEVLAMRLIERLVRAEDKPILYFHSKAVSHPLADTVYHEWRRLLMRETVCKWRQNLRYLRTHDAVGVNWWFVRGNNHFSGNFWLASAAWLRGLPKFDSIYRDRYSPEVWLGLRKGCRAKSLMCSDRRFWSTDRAMMLELCSQASAAEP